MAWYYARFGEAFANRVKLAKLLPILCLTTLLVIAVVKASLALSLGLVGALSIVRFRTAIKEPEELLYLFIAIAIGIGLGAGQCFPTMVAIALLLVFLISTRLVSFRSKRQNLYLSVRLPENEGRYTFQSVSEIVLEHADLADMRRMDSQDGILNLVFLMDLADSGKLAALVDDLKAKLPEISLSFVDQGDVPR